LPPDPRAARPLDGVAAAGPPAKPIDFPKPRFERGRRDNVCIYDDNTGSHRIANNVLFRDYSREYGENSDRALSRVRQAYWPVPHKSTISTIMGHVEICVVLTKCSAEASSDDEANNSGSDDSGDAAEDDDEDDEDVVFQVTTRHVAVKVNYSQRMEKYKGRHAENPLQEIAAMQLIGNANPHVMGLVEVLFDGENLNVVMPYAGSGDLFQLMQESQEGGSGFDEAEARFWFRQVIDGVRYLHSRGVCHRDLSPENIMLASDSALIIDMGMAIRVPYTDPNSADRGGVTDVSRGTHRRMILPQGACGKLPYMSPEIYRNKRPFDGGAVDVWTAGTILFCMVTGNRSYARPHDSDAQYYWMTHGLSRLLSDWGLHLSKECVHLLKHMLQVDPRLRLTLDEVIRHPWFDHPDSPPPPINRRPT
jgi:serine/threonine protein kinase